MQPTQAARMPMLLLLRRRMADNCKGACTDALHSFASPLGACFRYTATATAAATEAASPSRAPGAVIPCLAMSPSTPSPAIFRTLDSSSGSGSNGSGDGVVLHTGFKNRGTAAEASPGTTPSSPSFVVTSRKDFEAILAAALASVPAEASASTTTTTADETESASSPPSNTAAISPSFSSSASSRSLFSRPAGATEPVVVHLVEPGQHHNHVTRELQRLIRDVDGELAPMLAIKRSVDHYAYKRYYPLLKWGCLAVLATQFVVYFNWIFFVFDWNLVEPTTYFITYTGVFCSIVYHYLRCDASPSDEFTWRNLFVSLAAKKAHTLYTKKGLDIHKLNNLQATKRLAMEQLARYKP